MPPPPPPAPGYPAAPLSKEIRVPPEPPRIRRRRPRRRRQTLMARWSRWWTSILRRVPPVPPGVEPHSPPSMPFRPPSPPFPPVVQLSSDSATATATPRRQAPGSPPGDHGRAPAASCADGRESEAPSIAITEGALEVPAVAAHGHVEHVIWGDGEGPGSPAPPSLRPRVTLAAAVAPWPP